MRRKTQRKLNFLSHRNNPTEKRKEDRTKTFDDWAARTSTPKLELDLVLFGSYLESASNQYPFFRYIYYSAQLSNHLPSTPCKRRCISHETEQKLFFPDSQDLSLVGSTKAIWFDLNFPKKHIRTSKLLIYQTTITDIKVDRNLKFLILIWIGQYKHDRPRKLHWWIFKSYNLEWSSNIWTFEFWLSTKLLSILLLINH